MQTVSQAWKDAQKKNFVPEAFVDIVMSVGDPESQADAKPSDNGHESFSASEELANGKVKNPKKLATLERNLWVLNGSMKILREGMPPDGQGYVGNALSNNTCVFDSEIPTITISFSKVFTELIPGISVVWATAYDEYATRVRITSYALGSVTYRGEFDNTDMSSFFLADINNYDKITIEILEWCMPFRRARIESLMVGIRKVYTKKDLFGFEHISRASPLSDELPLNQIVMKIKNLNNEYNPENPKGAEKYLMERQRLDATYGYRINGEKETIAAGTFFISEWDTPQNGIEATFTARDALEFMNSPYTGTRSGSLYEIAVAAFEQANLPTMTDGSNRWYVDESLSAISAPDGIEASGETIAYVLQLVANAACCVLYQNRDGIIRLEPLPAGNTDYRIDRFVSYQNSDVSLKKQLKDVNVNNGQYVLSIGHVGDTQPVNNPFISDEQAPIVARWVADYLVNRKELSGEFRVDPRLDALDRVIVANQFAESVVLITEIEFTFNGAFRGKYVGRAGV